MHRIINSLFEFWDQLTDYKTYKYMQDDPKSYLSGKQLQRAEFAKKHILKNHSTD